VRGDGWMIEQVGHLFLEEVILFGCKNISEEWSVLLYKSENEKFALSNPTKIFIKIINKISSQ